jgi:hypothetical protein
MTRVSSSADRRPAGGDDGSLTAPARLTDVRLTIRTDAGPFFAMAAEDNRAGALRQFAEGHGSRS